MVTSSGGNVIADTMLIGNQGHLISHGSKEWGEYASYLGKPKVWFMLLFETRRFLGMKVGTSMMFC